MKVKQLDYSSMINANQMMLATRNAATANMAAKFNSENISAMESVYNKQGEAEKWIGYGKLVNSSIEAFSTATNIVATYKNAKTAQENAAATTDYTELVGQFQVKANDLKNNGQMFDSEGRYTDAYKALLDETNSAIDAMGYSKATKTGMKNGLASYASETYGGNLSDYINQLNTSTAEDRQTALDQAVNAAIAEGKRNTASAWNLIDSWNDLPEATKNSLKGQTYRAIMAGDVQNKANLETDTHGYNDGKKILDQALKDGEITQEQHDEMDAGIYTRHNNNLIKTAKAVSDTFKETLQTTGNIVTSRNAATAIIDKAPEEDRADLTSSLNQIQLGQFLSENQWYNNLQYMTSDEIQEKIDEVDDDKSKFFFGMDKEKAAAIAGMKIQQKANATSEAKALKTAEEEAVKTQTNNLKADIKVLSESLEGGFIDFEKFTDGLSKLLDNEGYSAIAGTSNAQALILEAYNDAVEKEGKKAKELSTQRKNDFTGINNMLISQVEAGTLSPAGYLSFLQGYRDQFVEIGDADCIAAAQNAINTLIDKTIPGWAKNDFSDRINSTLKMIGNLGIEGFDTADLQYGTMQKVLDFLIDYGKGDQGEKQINEFLDYMSEDSFKAAMKILETGGNTDYEWTGGYFEDSADLSDYAELLDAMATSQAYYTESGAEYVKDRFNGNASADSGTNVRGITKGSIDSWNRAAAIEASILKNLGIEADSYNSFPKITYASGPMKDANGEVIKDDDGNDVTGMIPVSVEYVPALLTDDGTYVIESSGDKLLVSRQNAQGGWDKMYTINKDNGEVKDSSGHSINLMLGTNRKVEKATEESLAKSGLPQEGQKNVGAALAYGDYENIELTPEEEASYNTVQEKQIAELSKDADRYDWYDFHRKYKGQYTYSTQVKAYFGEEWNASLEYLKKNKDQIQALKDGDTASRQKLALFLGEKGCDDEKIDWFISSNFVEYVIKSIAQ